MMFLFTCNNRPDIGNNVLSSFVTMECNSCINNVLFNYVVMWELLDKCFSIELLLNCVYKNYAFSARTTTHNDALTINKQNEALIINKLTIWPTHSKQTAK